MYYTTRDVFVFVFGECWGCVLSGSHLMVGVNRKFLSSCDNVKGSTSHTKHAFEGDRSCNIRPTLSCASPKTNEYQANG